MTPAPATSTTPTTPTRPARAPNALLLVLTRELRTRARSGGFLLSSLVTVVLLVAVIVVPTLFDGPTTYAVGVVGDGNRPLLDDAAQLAKRDASGFGGGNDLVELLQRSPRCRGRTPPRPSAAASSPTAA